MRVARESYCIMYKYSQIQLINNKHSFVITESRGEAHPYKAWDELKVRYLSTYSVTFVPVTSGVFSLPETQ